MRLRSPLAVTLIAVVVLAGLMALAVLMRPADQPSITGWEPSPAPLTSDVASPPAPTETFSAAERKFLAAVKPSSDEDPADAVKSGRDFCTGPPPEVGVLIENKLPDAVEPNAVRFLCPKYLPLLRQASTGFADGKFVVGKDVKPGTYRTVSDRVSDCYWERSSPGGSIIDNNMVTFASKGVTVTIAASDGGFTSQNCGDWVRAG